jgi:hypothetical protein
MVRFLSVVIGVGALLEGISKAISYWTFKIVPVDLLAAQFWPVEPKWLHHSTNATAKVVSGGFEHASVQVQGLTMLPRTMLAISALSLACVIILVCVQAYAVSTQIRNSEPFKDKLAKRFATSGVVVMVVGMVGQVTSMLGKNYAGNETLGTGEYFGWAQNSSGNGAALVPNPFVSPDGTNLVSNLVIGIIHNGGGGVGLEFWPIAVGLVLLVLARVFKRGQELAEETEGLI